MRNLRLFVHILLASAFCMAILDCGTSGGVCYAQSQAVLEEKGGERVEVNIEELGQKPFEPLYAYKNTDELLKDIEAYEELLARHTKEKSPRDYVTLRIRLGFSYLTLRTVQREKHVRLAAEDFGSAIELSGERGFKKEFYEAKVGLGLALQELPGDEHIKNLDEAVKVLEDAATYFTKEQNPQAYAIVSNSLGSAYSRLYSIGERKGDRLSAAETYFKQTLSVASHDKFPVQYGRAQIGLGNVYLALFGVGGDRLMMEKALGAFSDARTVFSEKFFPADYTSSIFLTALAYVGDEDYHNAGKYLEETMDVAGRTKDPRLEGFMGYMYSYEASQGLLE